MFRIVFAGSRDCIIYLQKMWRNCEGDLLDMPWKLPRNMTERSLKFLRPADHSTTARGEVSRCRSRLDHARAATTSTRASGTGSSPSAPAPPSSGLRRAQPSASHNPLRKKQKIRGNFFTSSSQQRTFKKSVSHSNVHSLSFK